MNIISVVCILKREEIHKEESPGLSVPSKESQSLVTGGGVLGRRKFHLPKGFLQPLLHPSTYHRFIQEKGQMYGKNQWNTLTVAALVFEKKKFFF